MASIVLTLIMYFYKSFFFGGGVLYKPATCTVSMAKSNGMKRQNFGEFIPPFSTSRS